MIPGCDGILPGVTARTPGVPFPHAFEGVTCMVPEPDPTVNVIEFVVPPPVWIHPAGNVQLYVIPGTFVTLYTCDVPWQGLTKPETTPIRPGANIGVTLYKVLIIPVPQPLVGKTCMSPLSSPTVTVTEFVVPPEVCVHPAGKVQLYVIPLIFSTEYVWDDK